MRLLITGGHMSPALAVIDYINRSKKSVEIVFVGRKYTDYEKKDLSIEFKEIKHRGLKFINLETGRFTWLFALKTLNQFLLFFKGVFNSWQIINEHRPDKVLSFGGYIALPIALTAYLRKIPVYTHEQTIHPGLANKLIGFFAFKIFISFPQTKQFFVKNKVILSGNPVRSDVFSFNKNNDFFYIKKDKPVIYVTGGSLGSHSINMHVKKILPELLSKFTVIHQTGNVKEYNDYKVLSDYIKTLPDYLKNSYFIKKHFQTGEVGTVFNIADLVISRAGANTLFELIALKKTAVLVPLPWSSHGEQEKQALMLKKEGGAEVFYQQEDSNKLLVLVNKVLKDKKSYINNLLKLQKLYVQDAAKVITEEIIAK